MAEEMEMRVLAALAAVHAPSTTAAARAEASQYLEQINHNFEQCYLLGMRLFTNAATYDASLMPFGPHPVRHCGLQFLHRAVFAHWASFSPAQQEEVKVTALAIAEKLGDLKSDPAFVRESSVKFAVEVAIRVWPQRWPDLFEKLTLIGEQGQAQHKDFVLKFLRSLAESIRGHSSRDLPKKRKEELIAGLKASLSGILTFCYRLLETCMQNRSPESMTLARSGLDTLAAFVEWAPLEELIKFKFGHLFCFLLKELECRMLAIECLVLMVSRKGRTDHRISLLFPFDEMPLIASSISVQDDDAHTFHKAMAQLLCLCGSAYLDVKDKLPKEKLLPNFEMYLSIMMAFLEHESHLLNSFVLPFWSASISHGLDELPCFQPMVQKLYSTAIKKLRPISFPGNQELEPYTLEDFESEDAFSYFFSVFTHRFSLLVEKLAKKHGELALQLVGPTIEPTLASGNDVNVHTMVEFIKYVLRGLSSAGQLKTERIIPMGRAIAEFILPWNCTKFPATQGLLLMTEQSRAIVALFPILKECQDICVMALFKLLEMLHVLPGPEAGTLAPPDVLATRRTICCSVVKLSKFASQNLLPALGKMRSAVAQMQEKLFQFERAFLAEAVVHVGNALKDYAKQRSLLESLLGPIATQIVSQDVKGVVQSPAALATFLGLGGDVVAQETVRGQMYDIFSLFTNIVANSRIPRGGERKKGGFIDSTGKTQDPTADFLQCVLPVSMSLAAAIHGLYEDDIRKAVPEQLKGALGHDDADTRNLLNAVKLANDDNDESSNPQQIAGHAEVRSVQLWLTSMRSSAYRLFSIACNRLPNALQSLSAEVIHSVYFKFVPSMDDIHLRTFYRHLLSPLLRNCPTSLYSSLLAPLLQYLFQYIQGRLDQEWILFEDRKTNNGGGSAKEEIIEDLLLRMITKEFLDVVKAHYITLVKVKKPAPGKKPVQTVPTKLWEFSMNQPAIVKPLLLILSNSIAYPDSSAQHVALELLTVLIPCIGDKQVFLEFLAQHLMPKLLSALSLQPVSSGRVGELAHAVELAYRCCCSRPAAIQLLLQIPGIQRPALEQYTKDLLAKGHTKQSRQQTKELLRELIGARTVEQLGKEKIEVQDLIEQLFLRKVNDYSNSWQEASSTDLDIASLWGGQ